MPRLTLLRALILVAWLGGACLPGPNAHAASSNTFVSAATGSDNNDCSRTAPCRTLTRALVRTAPGGEIAMIDAGRYPPVTIEQAVTIVAEAPGATIAVIAGAIGVTVNAGTDDVVRLRGIGIKGLGVGAGILFNSGGALIVDGCMISDLNGTGILFRPVASSELVVSNTLVSNVGGRGIHLNPPSTFTGAAKAVITRSQVHVSTDIGIFAHGTGSDGTIDMTVSDSVATGHPGDGMRANSLLGSTTRLSIVRSVAVNNGTGISAANPNATVRVAQSMVTGNVSGWLAEGNGTLLSFGDNYVEGNTTNQATMPLVGKK